MLKAINGNVNRKEDMNMVSAHHFTENLLVAKGKNVP